MVKDCPEALAPSCKGREPPGACTAEPRAA